MGNSFDIYSGERAARGLRTGLRVNGLSSSRQPWKAAPITGHVRRVLAPRIYAACLAAERQWRRAPPLSQVRPGPLIVSGFHNDVLGIGRGAAQTFDALERGGLQPIRHDVRPVISSRPYHSAPLPAGPGGVWIQHCNAPENDLVFNRLRLRDISDRYRIGYWAWELPRAPLSWRATARAFHEIWTPSQFVADAISPHVAKVRVMPHPLRATTSVPPDRRRFDLPEGAVVFGAFADVRSSLARKNPLGAIQAYIRAFPKANGATLLSVKLVAPEADPAGVAALHAAAGGRSDIRIWSRRLSNADMAAYFASLDVVVSLHRSEGFGLVVAEAYLAGKSVVATAWSGNLDFVQPEAREMLVPASLTPVRDPTGQYRGGSWAEPDLDHAALVMRRLAADPGLRRAMPAAIPRVEADLQRRWSLDELSRNAWFRYLAQTAS